MSEEQLTNYQTILTRLRAIRSNEENVSLMRGILLSASVAISIVLGILVIEALAYSGVTTRTALFAAALLAALTATGITAGPDLLRKAGILPRNSDDEIALKVGAHFPGMKDRLLNVLQLVREERRRKRYSPQLIDASFATVARSFETLDLTPVVDRTPARKAGRISLFAFGAAFAAFGLFPTPMFEAAHRVLHFRTDFAPPAPFEFLVEPGDLEVVRGGTVTLLAKTSALFNPSVTFHIKEKEQTSFDPVPTTMDETKSYVHRIEGVRNSFSYYAEADGYRSRIYTVSVVDRPFIRSMRLKLTFPSYTKLPPRYLDENAGDVTALAGTLVSFDLTFNKELSSAVIEFSDSQRVPLSVQHLTGTGQFRLSRDRSYHIELMDPSGIGNQSPITYELKVVPDLHPTVHILEPGPMVDLSEAMRAPLIAGLTDDYGFTKLLLHYRLSASKYEQPWEKYSNIIIPLPSQQRTEMEAPYLWNLSSLGLVPEDVVQYYLEVFDNDAVNGPKSSRSPVYTVRLPSLDEVFAKADRTQDKAIDDLQKTLSDAQEVQKAMEALQREMKQQNTEKLDWQQKKKLEDLAKRHEKMMEDVKKVNEELSKLNEELQKHNVVSPETMQKYQELTELMREIDSPEFRDALKKMNEATQQMTPEQMKQAMENFQLSEESFRKSIERTIDLLKRIQIEQKVDELTRRAEDLAKKQEDLAERTANTDPKNQEALDKLAKEQEELRKQTEAMSREMKELQEKMEEFAQEMPLQEMQDAQSELNLAEMQQQMSQAASQCQGGNCQSASTGMKKMAQQMQKFQKKMEQVQKKMNEDQKRAVQQAFRKALDNVLNISKRQEQLKNEVASLPPNSQQFREATQRQLDLMEQLNKTANELMELGKKTFAVNEQMGRHIGEAMRQMRQSLESMQQRSNRAAGDQQGGAMAELNEAAKQIAKGMQAGQQGGSQQGGMLMQQLQAMAQRQMSINQGSQQMGQQGQMSQQRMAQMQRLAQQQAALQKSLEQLNEEAKRSTEGKRLLGDLEKIAEEMQEVVRDMQQNDINPNTLQKQERILSRMLDASRSMRERDWEKRRKSETGTDVARRGPGALDPSLLDPASGVKTDLQRAIEEGYSRDYEQLIRQYFEALQKVVMEGSKDSQAR